MQSLRYLRFKFCKNESGSQAKTGTSDHNLITAKQFGKIKPEKAHIPREGGVHSPLLSGFGSPSLLLTQERSRDRLGLRKEDNSGPRHFNPVLCMDVEIATSLPKMKQNTHTGIQQEDESNNQII